MKNLLLPLLAVALLPACATHRMSDNDRLGIYQTHPGEAVKQVRYASTLGWDRIDDQHIVLTTKPTESLLLTVSGPCLSWGGTTPVLRLETRMPGLLALFDRITTGDAPTSCQIQEIRQVDVEAVRKAETQSRAR